MKNFLMYALGIIILSSGLFLASCNKSDDLDNEVIENSAENASTRDRLDSPTMTRDRYVFRDTTHLKDFYGALSDIYDRDEETFIRTIQGLGRVKTVFLKQLNDEFTKVEDAYQPFLSDPVMAAILNEHFEMQVGDALITYVNNEKILGSLASDTDVQRQIRAMEKGREITPRNIPAGAYWGDDTELESFLGGGWCGCNIKVEQIDCEVMRVSGKCSNFWGNDGNGFLRIYRTDFQNPLPPANHLIQSGNVNGNFQFDIDVSSSFPTSKSVFAHVDPSCFTGQNKWAFNEFSENGSCDKSEKTETGAQFTSNLSSVMIYRTSNYENFWNYYHSAQIWSYSLSNGRFRRQNARLSTRIDATKRIESCNVYETENETKTCSSCSYKRARVNAGIWGYPQFYHCDGDVVGTYSKTHSSGSFSAVLPLDFECCE